jgi:hypothetical protein
VVALIIIRVCPSGAASASVPSATRLPAPGRLSTTTLWPNTSAKFAEMLRETLSMPPPAASGTSTRIGRVGKFCAWATVVISTMNSDSRVMPILWFMMFSLLRAIDMGVRSLVPQ